jgi:hypothetical protein
MMHGLTSSTDKIKFSAGISSFEDLDCKMYEKENI